MKGLKIAGWLFSKCWIDLSNCHLTPLMCSSFSDDHSLPSSCILLPHLFLQTTNWKHSNVATRQSEISNIFSNRFSLCWRNCRKPTTNNQLVLAPTRALLHYPFESNSRYSPKLTSYAAQFHCFYIFRSYSLLRKPWPSLGRHWWLNAVNFGQFSSPMNRTCLNLVKHWQSFYLL